MLRTPAKYSAMALALFKVSLLQQDLGKGIVRDIYAFVHPTVPAQVANAIFLMPRDQRDSNPVIQAMLQGMCWCEKDRQADLASRNAYIASQGKVSPRASCTSSARLLP